MRRSKILLAIGVLALAAACAKAPEMEMNEAQTSINDARTAAQADVWAPEDLQAAQSSFDAAKAEVEVQNERFALTRNYDKATELFAQAKVDAEKAKRAAVDNKEKARMEAEQNLQRATDAIAAARDALTKAPRTKGTRADIELFTSDLTGLEGSLEEVRAAIAAQDYKKALSRAAAIIQEAEDMTAKLTEAAMRAGR